MEAQAGQNRVQGMVAEAGQNQVQGMVAEAGQTVVLHGPAAVRVPKPLPQHLVGGLAREVRHQVVH